MMRDEVRRRALRAAAAVSLTVGLAGCGAEVRTESATTGMGGSAAAGGGAGGLQGIGGAGGGGGAIEDAGTSAPQCDVAAVDYAACCEDAGWSPDAGCTPWGPPMPPAMEEVA